MSGSEAEAGRVSGQSSASPEGMPLYNRRNKAIFLVSYFNCSPVHVLRITMLSGAWLWYHTEKRPPIGALLTPKNNTSPSCNQYDHHQAL